MARTSIDQLIVNSPYEEPAKHWRYDRQARVFDLAAGRRPAGYVVASSDSKAFDDPGVFVEIPLANRIRSRVQAWRDAGYPGVTKRLLEHFLSIVRCIDPAAFERFVSVSSGNQDLQRWKSRGRRFAYASQSLAHQLDARGPSRRLAIEGRRGRGDSIQASSYFVEQVVRWDVRILFQDLVAEPQRVLTESNLIRQALKRGILHMAVA